MYEFYLDDLLLPVAPESVDTKISNQNKTVTLINEGEINLLKSPGLTEISFTAFIPGVKYPWARYQRISASQIWHPIKYLNKLEELKNSLEPFTFLIFREWHGKTDKDFKTNIRVTLESYTIKEAAKNGEDIMVDIKLKQYKPFGTKTITIKQETAEAASEREAPSNPPKSYTVDYGDTLGGIAQKTMGDGTKWPKIYELNKAAIEDAAVKAGHESAMNGNIIVPGTVIKIPQE